MQAQPQIFGAGFSFIRITINGTTTPKHFFGNFAAGDTTITDGNNAAFDICGVYDPSSSNLVSSSRAGYFDVLNFVWFQGAQVVSHPTSGNYINLEKSDLLLGFICFFLKRCGLFDSRAATGRSIELLAVWDRILSAR